jgi:putative FmdB family regulatory protein
MPIYEYECRKCNAHTEVLQKYSDKPLTKCRKCGGRLEKLLSAAAIQFKGSGWYVTDYAGKKPDTSEEKKSPGEKKSAEASTTDNKPASKEKSAGKKGAPAKKSSASTGGD